ncbi:MAG: HNH endonuclease [Chloroflexi bacterium]|nr:HNH endonuclease [Chloroflexota bacterium]MBI3734329.1 HNH endonuclease [Chloroflexota bacterium]
MPQSQWEQEVRQWANTKAEPELIPAFIEFFRRAFIAPAQQYPENVWFGVHQNRISLIVGNLWLAGVRSNDKSVFLLVDADPQIPGLAFGPARSTQNYIPLGWVAIHWDGIDKLLNTRRVWDSYALACEKVLASPVGRPRPETYYRLRWGKRKLSELRLAGAINPPADKQRGKVQKANEGSSDDRFIEGGVQEITVELRRRNRQLRAQAIAKYGQSCQVCGFNFGKFYGALGEGYIEVHHLIPLSNNKKERAIAIKDVAVVCANCHRILHHKGREPLPLNELQQVVKKQRHQ